MNKILMSLLTITLVSFVAVGATQAYFSDTETSNSNTFTAGTLDLTVGTTPNGSNTVKFTVAKMRPGNQPTGQYRLNNVGSIDGYLDLENISVTNNENGCIEPEVQAGDTITCGTPGAGEGELQNVVNMRLYWDNDCNSSFSTGDTWIFNGMTGTVVTNYDANKALNSGATQCMVVLFDWWNTANDNLAMGDDMTLNMTFELGQTIGQ